MAETIAISTTLYEIGVATGRKELDQLKLGAECVGITPGNLDGVTSVTDVFNCLKNNKATSNEPIPILYELLTKANVTQSKVKLLLASCTKQAHETCKQRRDLQFALLMIDICNGIEAASLKSFRGFFIDATAISHDKHPTIEKLLQFLVQNRVVWLEKLENLENALERIGKRDVLEKVQAFKNLRGFQRQESSEQRLASPSTGISMESQDGKDSQRSIANGHGVEHGALDSTVNSTSPFRGEQDPLQHENGGVTTVSESENGIRPCSNVQGGNVSRNNGTNDFSELSIPKITKTRQCISKLKTMWRWIVAILIVIIFIVPAISVAITFVVLYCKQTNGIAKNVVDVTSLAHDGDTIYLGTVDGTWYQNISITEVTQDGDASHVNNVFLTDKDPKKHSTLLVHQSHTLHQDSSSYETGSVRYQYLLDGSSVQYTMCLAYRTSGELYDSMVYVFNNAQHYWDYINEVPGAELYVICSKKLEVGTYNRSMCTPLECRISYPAFHFIAAKTGGDIFYNFSYTIDKVYLNRSDYSEVCNVFEGTDCKRDLPEATLYHVLAYTVHSESIESSITHLFLKTGTPLQTVSSNIMLYMILFIVCGCLALILALVLIGMCCYKCRRGSSAQTTNSESTENLLQDETNT